MASKPTVQETTMKAIVYHQYGTPDVLALEEIDTPVVGNNEVLIRVHASSVNAGDWHMMTGTPYMIRPMAGLLKPKRNIPGGDVAGRVEAVGADVTQFAPGDEVFGEIEGGAYAEYVAVPAHDIVLKPANLTFQEAAAVPVAGLTALQGLREHGRLQSGHKVLINGASGGVGTFAVQVAKALGAEVTAVCSTANVEMVRSIGADHVIDYYREDFTKTGRRYDLMFDVAGNRSVADCKSMLEPGGTYVPVGGRMGRVLGPLPRLVRAALAFRFGNQRLAWFVARMDQEDMTFLAELLESGQLKPVIENTYSLTEAATALRHVGGGHAKGKNVITV